MNDLEETNAPRSITEPLIGLAEFIELCGGFELKPYQRELAVAIERGERLLLDPVTMREPYREWKQRYEDYLRAMRNTD